MWHTNPYYDTTIWFLSSHIHINEQVSSLWNLYSEKNKTKGWWVLRKKRRKAISKINELSRSGFFLLPSLTKRHHFPPWVPLPHQNCAHTSFQAQWLTLQPTMLWVTFSSISGSSTELEGGQPIDLRWWINPRAHQNDLLCCVPIQHMFPGLPSCLLGLFKKRKKRQRYSEAARPLLTISHVVCQG